MLCLLRKVVLQDDWVIGNVLTIVMLCNVIHYFTVYYSAAEWGRNHQMTPELTPRNPGSFKGLVCECELFCYCLLELSSVNLISGILSKLKTTTDTSFGTKWSKIHTSSNL